VIVLVPVTNVAAAVKADVVVIAYTIGHADPRMELLGSTMVQASKVVATAVANAVYVAVVLVPAFVPLATEVGASQGSIIVKARGLVVPTLDAVPEAVCTA